MEKMEIDYNNTLYRNKMSLLNSLHDINKEISKAQDECTHIPAQLFYDTTYCIVCRKQLTASENDINLVPDGPLEGNIPFSTYIDKKLAYLQAKLLKVLDENPKASHHEIKSKLEEKINEEGYYDREVRSYRKKI